MTTPMTSIASTARNRKYALLCCILSLRLGERRQLACDARQPAEHDFRRQAADECRPAACAPQISANTRNSHSLAFFGFAALVGIISFCPIFNLRGSSI